MIGSSSSSINNSNSRRRELRLSSSSSALSSSTTTTTTTTIGSGIRSSRRSSSSRRKLVVYYLMIAILILIFLFSNIQYHLNNPTTTNTNTNDEIIVDKMTRIVNNNNNPRINNIADIDIDVDVAVKQPPAITTTTTTVEKEEELPLVPSYVRNGGSCAILLFGLPRSFQQYVLPSIQQHIIRPNLHYNCDYYIHYYDLGFEKEESGRSGRGGIIHSNDIYLLNQTIYNIYKDENQNNNNNNNDMPKMRMPIIKFISDTNETFWNKRSKEIMKYRTTKEEDNGKNNGNGKNKGNNDKNYKYFPYKELTYVYPKTIDNIVKQWHSIHSVWKLMEQYNTVKEEDNEEDTESIKKKKNMKKKKKYRRIAMIRNDVMYITPIDIYEIPKLELTTIPGKDYTKAVPSSSKKLLPQQQRQSQEDERQYDYIENRISVIPNFAKYPVNDRFIYGPYDCVKIWAFQRFTQIEEYANNNSNNSSPRSIPGMVMHSETFLNASILQSIKELKYSPSLLPSPSHPNSNSIISAEGNNNNNYYEIREDRFICFLRVRADGAIWYEDCDPKKSDYGGGYPGGIGNFNTITGSIVKQDVNNGDTNTGYINKIYSLLEIINDKKNQTSTANTKIKCRRRRLKDPVRLIYELICK